MLITVRKVKVPAREPYLSNQVTEDELAYAIMLDRAECFNDGDLEDRYVDGSKSYVVEELNQAVYSDEWLQDCFDTILEDDPEEVEEKERYLIERILEARKLEAVLMVKLYARFGINSEERFNQTYVERFEHYKSWLVKTLEMLLSQADDKREFGNMIHQLGLYDSGSLLYKQYVIDNLK
jgi:hypothetical protein